MLRPARIKALSLSLPVQARLASTSSSAYPFPSHAHPTPHQIFHLSHGASQADIKTRYYDLVRTHHPDSPACRTVPPEVRHARFQAITAAYDALCGRVTPTSFDAGSPYAEELARRRAQHRRRQEYRSRYAPQADALNARGDEAWKDHVILVVGLASLIVGFAPALMSMSTAHDQRHLSAAANLAAARREAREFGGERRQQIRRRVAHFKEDQARDQQGGAAEESRRE